MTRSPNVSRRSLLRGFIGAIVGVPTLAFVTSASAEPVAGRVRTTTNGEKWISLPGSGGLQVHCTDARGGKVEVDITWTADGRVTASYPFPLTVTAPSSTSTQAVASGAGFGIAVRR